MRKIGFNRERRWGGIVAIAAIGGLLPVAPATAQDTASIFGSVTETSTGKVGQRQTPVQASPNIKPMERINNRIQNRVQSRIPNRLDRDGYAQQPDATSAFVSAQARSATKPNQD